MREIICAADGIHHDRKLKGQTLRPKSNTYTYSLTANNAALVGAFLHGTPAAVNGRQDYRTSCLSGGWSNDRAKLGWLEALR
jgi:hypothetical protein